MSRNRLVFVAFAIGLVATVVAQHKSQRPSTPFKATFVCTLTENSIPCEESEKYYALNEALGKVEESTEPSATDSQGNEIEPTTYPSNRPTRPTGPTSGTQRPPRPTGSTADYPTTQRTQRPTKPTQSKKRKQ